MSRKRNKGFNDPKKLASRKKQAEAIALRIAGHSLEEIAQKIGYSGTGAVHNLLKRAFRDSIQEPADELRRIELARLDKMWKSLWTAVTDPEGNPHIGPAPEPEAFQKESIYKTVRASWEEKRLKAHETLLKIQKRRAELLGLDAPKVTKNKNEVTGKDGEAIQVNQSFQVDLSNATEEQLDNLISKLETGGEPT